MAEFSEFKKVDVISTEKIQLAQRVVSALNGWKLYAGLFILALPYLVQAFYDGAGYAVPPVVAGIKAVFWKAGQLVTLIGGADKLRKGELLSPKQPTQ